MILSFLIFCFLALLISFILNVPVGSAVFYIVFCILRNCAKGIHADTEAKCTIFTTISINVSLVLVKLFIAHNLIVLSSVRIFLAIVCLFAFAPLSTEHKEIDEIERYDFAKLQYCTLPE